MGERYDERLEQNPHDLALRTNTKVKNAKYPDLEDTQHMDLSDQQLGCAGLMSIVTDLFQDQQLLQVDLSYNINLEEAFQPKRMARLSDHMCLMIQKNQFLTALDLVGNHMGNFGPHPFNEQMRDIVLDLAKALPKSNIRRLDISDNALTGTMGTCTHHTCIYIHTYTGPGGSSSSANPNNPTILTL